MSHDTDPAAAGLGAAEGLLAVAIQHEMDHLDGKLFIDRLSPLKKELARKKLIRERREEEELGSPTPRKRRRGGPEL